MSYDDEDAYSSGNLKVNKRVSHKHADEAFASSSEDGDVKPLRGSQFTRLITPASSEFNTALLSGIPNIGIASLMVVNLIQKLT
jgi:hypothetical protein